MAQVLMIARTLSRSGALSSCIYTKSIRINAPITQQFYRTISMNQPVISFEPKSPLSQSSSSPNSTELDLTEFLKPVAETVVNVPTEAVANAAYTASDLGITWWLPTNLVFNFLEKVHTVLPWWGSIAVLCVCVRFLVFPLMIINMRSTALMSHTAPQMAMIHAKVKKAMKSGNPRELSNATSDMQLAQIEQFKKMKGSLFANFAQAPLFIAVFATLRAYSAYPVESMQNEGLFWFTNLTASDPYYLLPFVCGLTTFTIMKVGVEFGNSDLARSTVAKNAFLYGPATMITAFALFGDFPTSIQLYWIYSNLFSIAQSTILRQQKVRTFFKIPERKIWKPEEMPPAQSFNESWSEFKDSIKQAKELSQREATARAFEKAGRDPPRAHHKPKWQRGEN